MAATVTFDLTTKTEGILSDTVGNEVKIVSSKRASLLGGGTLIQVEAVGDESWGIVEFNMGDVKLKDVGLGKGKTFKLIRDADGKYTGQIGLGVVVVEQKPAVAAKPAPVPTPARRTGAPSVADVRMRAADMRL